MLVPPQPRTPAPRPTEIFPISVEQAVPLTPSSPPASSPAARMGGEATLPTPPPWRIWRSASAANCATYASSCKPCATQPCSYAANQCTSYAGTYESPCDGGFIGDHLPTTLF